MKTIPRPHHHVVHRRLACSAAACVALLQSACSVPFNTGLGAPSRPPVTVADSAEAVTRAYETGNADEAKRLLRDARDAAATKPEEQPQLARTLTAIAVQQSRLGNNAEALELHTQALALRESSFGPNNPEVADSLSFLAAAYYQAQRYGEAEDAFRRALQVRQHHFGADHRLTGLSMNNLAFFYAGLGRYVEADPLFLESIRILSESEDASWGEKARALDNYAAMLLDADRADEAAEIQKQSQLYRTKKRQVEDIIRMSK